MPRRSTRVASPAQDDIEVDDQVGAPSQQNLVPNEDLRMDESADNELPEQQPARHSKKAKASKSKSKVTTIKSEGGGKSHTPRDASDDEAASEGDGPPFDRDEFLATARPIPTDGAKTIDGVISDLQTVLHQLEHTGFGLVLDTAVAVEEVSGNTDESEEAATQLDVVMRQLVDAQQELKIHQQSLDSLKQSILRGEVLGDLTNLYTTNVSDAMQDYNRCTTRQKYAKHKEYFKFRDRVWEVNHDDAMPPLGDILPREDADSDADSDIEVGGMTQDYKCPITLRPLTDPLTSKLCGHSFSAEAIREYIVTGRGRTDCPATGCSRVLTLNDLEVNEDLANRAANAVRRAKRREENSDESEAEEVVD